ncbi:MAG: hypothetical protein AAFR05_15490, partial [Bacteroidota bacterium]
RATNRVDQIAVFDLQTLAQGNQVLRLRIEDASADDVHAALRELPTVALVDILDAAQQRFEVQSRPEASSNREIFQLCVRRNWLLSEMVPLEAKLEDVFRDLTVN